MDPNVWGLGFGVLGFRGFKVSFLGPVAFFGPLDVAINQPQTSSLALRRSRRSPQIAPSSPRGTIVDPRLFGNRSQSISMPCETQW